MKINKNFILVLSVSFIVGGLFLSNSIYSQEGNSTGSENEFKGVEIIKPSSGFLVIENNWIVDRSGIVDEKLYMQYRLYDEDGKLFRKIPASRLSAQKITLPEGLYYVKYNDKNDKVIRYGVKIEAGKTTLIQ